MLYKNLPKNVGLRRITLHKSMTESSGHHVTYLLMVECANFMEHIGECATLLPTLSLAAPPNGLGRWLTDPEDTVDRVGLKDMFCIDKPFTLNGNFYSEDYERLIMDVNKCTNSSSSSVVC